MHEHVEAGFSVVDAFSALFGISKLTTSLHKCEIN